MHFSVYRTQIWSPLFCHHFQYIHENVKVQICWEPNLNPQKLLQNDCLGIGLDCLWLFYLVFIVILFKQKKAPHYATIAVCEQFFVVHTIYYLVRWRGSLFCLFIADEKALKLKKRSDDRDRRVTNTNNHCGAQMDNKRRRVNPPPHSGSYFATH